MNRKKHIEIVSQRVHSHLIYPNHWFNVANARRILQNCRNQNNLCEGKNGQIIISHYFVTAKRHIPNTLAQRVPYYGFNIAKRKQKNQTNIEEERKEEKKLSQLQKLLSGEKKVGNSLAIQIFAEFSILTIFLFIIIRMMDKSGKKTHQRSKQKVQCKSEINFYLQVVFIWTIAVTMLK